MIFKKITIENFKSYRGSHTLEFATGEEKNITLIAGENNHGKSVLLEAVKWCLYNEFPPKKRMPFINKDVLFEYGKVDVMVSLMIEHQEQTYVIQRKTSVFSENETINPKSRLYISGNSKDGTPKKIHDFETTEDFELFIDSLLPPSVSKYFLVDGDRIDNFTDPTDNKTKKAIEDLLKLNRIDRGKTHLIYFQTQLNKELIKKAGPNANAEVDAEKYDDIVKKIDHNRKRRKKIEGDLAKLENFIFDLEEKTAEATESEEKQKNINNNKNIIDQLGDRRNDILKELSIQLGYSYLLFLRPTILEVFSVLETNRETGKIPKPYNEIFIEDILKDLKCICGTKFKKDDKHYKILQKVLNETPSKKITDKIYNTNPILKNCSEMGGKLVKFEIDPRRDKLDVIDKKIEKLINKKFIIDYDSKLKVSKFKEGYFAV